MRLFEDSELGSSPIEFVAALGLLMVPITIMVVSFAPWVERQSMATLAAREAVRVVVLSESPASPAYSAGTAAAYRIAANHGVPSGDVDVSFCGGESCGPLVRGGVVTATVTVTIPVVSVPGMGSVGGVGWTTSHSEQVDLYRSLSDP